MFWNRNNLYEQNACFQTTVCFLKPSKTDTPNFKIPEMIISASSEDLVLFSQKKVTSKGGTGMIWKQSKQLNSGYYDATGEYALKNFSLLYLFE